MHIAKAFVVAALLTVTAGCATKSSTELKTLDQYERAIEAYQAGRYADAESRLLSLLEKFPQFAEGWYRLGNLYVRTGQHEAAINAYNSCLRYDANFTKAWHNLSLAHLKVAIQVLEEGMRNNGDDRDATEQLAQLRRAMLEIGNHTTRVAAAPTESGDANSSAE